MTPSLTQQDSDQLFADILISVCSAGLGRPGPPYAETLHLDSTRVCLDRESWSSSNTGSDVVRRSNGHLPGSHPPRGNSAAFPGCARGTKDQQSKSADMRLKLWTTSQADRGLIQGYQAGRPEHIRAKDLQDFLAKSRPASAAETGRKLGNASVQSLSSQDVRQGLHLRSMPSNAARPSSGSVMEHSSSYGAESRGGKKPEQRRVSEGQSSWADSAHLDDLSDHNFTSLILQPRAPDIDKRRALQTVPYRFMEDNPNELQHAAKSGSSQSPPSDESLQWVVGAEDAKSLQHAAWQDELRSHVPSLQNREQHPRRKSSTSSGASSLRSANAFQYSHAPKEASLSNKGTVAAARSLQTQPFQLDLKSSTAYNPLHSQPVPALQPMPPESPRLETVRNHRDLHSSKLEPRLRDTAGHPGDPDQGSQYSQRSGYRTARDYGTPSGAMLDPSNLHIAYETQQESNAPVQKVSTPSIASEIDAGGQQRPRLRSIQQVRSLPVEHCHWGSSRDHIYKTATYH